MSTVTGAPVVVGVDGSKSGLVAVHAWTHPVSTGPGDMLPLVYDVNGVEAEEQRVLAESVAGWCDRYPEVPVAHRLVRGPTRTTLIDESARGAPLLVVGARGRDGFAGLLLGSVSQAVLHHAGCPVAVIRAPHAGQSHRPSAGQ